MNKAQRHALHTVLSVFEYRGLELPGEVIDAIAELQPLLQPRRRTPKIILARHDQLPLPVSSESMFVLPPQPSL